MAAYLGTLGRLVELWTVSGAQLSEGDRYSFDQTLEGVTQAQLSKFTSREWSLSADGATPGEVATMLGFAQGEWGKGPFIFVDPIAGKTNMLTPRQGMCLDLMPPPGSNPLAIVNQGGPVNLGADGWFGRHWSTSQDYGTITINHDLIPVRPGDTVTGAAWARGAAGGARIYFYDENGVFISVTASKRDTDPIKWKRVFVSGVVPANAVGARLGFTQVTEVARPTFTWTKALMPWGPGHGCPQAVVSSHSRQLGDAIVSLAGEFYSDLSFTIKEVGR